MTSELVINTLVKILNKRIMLREVVAEDDYDVLLTSQKIGLDYTHMIEYMMCVEEAFEVVFTIEELRKGGFRTIQSISDLIYKKCLR